MTHRPVVLLLAAGLGAHAFGAASPPQFERAIEGEVSGRVRIRLDRDVYEAARPDLGDLRVLDEDGREVPYVIDRAGTDGHPPEVRPSVRNRGWRADGAATAVLDFGRRLGRSRLHLRLTGDNFRRRVAVDGGDDGARWTALVDEAWVFAVPGREPARYESVELPDNDFPLLRLVVHPAPDEKDRPGIEDAWVLAEGPRSLPEEPLEPRWTVAEDPEADETWLTIDLGARHQPFHAVELDVADERFFREVRVEARRDAGPAAGSSPLRWDEIARGAIYRLDHAGRRAECLRIEARGRGRTLRLRVDNRDNRPLRVQAVSVRAPVEQLLFEAPRPGRYRLTYGSPDRPAPLYDLARTVGDLDAWAGTARPARLGPPSRLEVGRGESPPWTERHPALLWAGLLAVVVALGALTRQALRRAG